MPIDSLQSLEIIEIMENFLSAKRPPEDIRDRLDIGYRIDNQSIFIFEIRPRYQSPEEKVELDVAKTTYVKSKDLWKVYWKRGDLKWYPYDPQPTVKNLNAFARLVEEDSHACFWG
jgi:hypothetical protein